MLVMLCNVLSYIVASGKNENVKLIFFHEPFEKPQNKCHLKMMISNVKRLKYHKIIIKSNFCLAVFMSQSLIFRTENEEYLVCV